MQIRRDLSSGHKPRTKQEMRAVGKDDAIPLNFDRSKPRESLPKAGGGGGGGSKCDTPAKKLPPRAASKYAAQGEGAGGANEGQGAQKGSVSEEQYNRLLQRLVMLEHTAMEQGKDLASIELQEISIFALLYETNRSLQMIFTRVSATPWIA